MCVEWVMEVIKKPEPVEVLDNGKSYRVYFDVLDEEDAVRVMVDILKNGIPEERVVKKAPKFLEE